MSIQYYLKDLIVNDVVPFWYENGIDRNSGFYEELDFSQKSIDAPRRTRLVSRQIYSFILASELGWDGPYKEVVEHGLNFLEKFLISKEGQVFKSIDLKNNFIDKTHDTYDYSFLFLALAKTSSINTFREKTLLMSEKSLKWLNNNWKHKLKGYIDSPKSISSMKSNPHMHLLEAAIEWIKVSKQIENKDIYLVWKEIGEEIVELALNKMIDKKNGSLSEYFDQEWNSEKNNLKKIIEPGHNYEWGWLLLIWEQFFESPDLKNKAKNLIFIAENNGISRNDLVFSEIDGNFTTRNENIKLWPQTERLKAWHLLSRLEIMEEKNIAQAKFENSLKNLMNFIHESPKGMWFDFYDENIISCKKSSKASSFYHIILAIHSIFYS